MLEKKMIALPIAAALTLGLVAGGATGATRKTTLHVSADPGGDFKFTKKRLVAKHAGKITIVMKNPSSAGQIHGIAIAGHKKGAQVDPGKTSRVTATLKKGRYTFYCPVPGHRALGMKGTLVVK
jgi:plastocyanin